MQIRKTETFLPTRVNNIDFFNSGVINAYLCNYYVINAGVHEGSILGLTLF